MPTTELAAEHTSLSGPGLILLLLGMALCAFATRWLPLALLRGRELTGPLAKAVGYVPVAVLAAMVAPELMFPAGDGGSDLLVPSLVGGAVTLGLGLATKRMLLAAVLGMVVFFLTSHFTGAS